MSNLFLFVQLMCCDLILSVTSSLSMTVKCLARQLLYKKYFKQLEWELLLNELYF